MRWRSPGFAPARAALLLLWIAAAPAWSAEPAQVLEAIRSARLDTAAARTLQGVTLQPGPARIHLDAGTLYPGTHVGERSLESVFVGRGRFTLETADPM